MIKKITLALAVIALSGCATIVTKSEYPVNVSSQPAGAKFTITDRDGKVVSSGETPTTLKLASGHGYFKKGIYTIKYEKAGYETKTYTLEPSINGWYFGNFASWGPIGLFIVDPLTGAMYKLPPEASVSLSSSQRSDNGDLKVLSLKDLTEEQKAKLVRLN